MPTSENIVREGYTFTGWEIVANTQPYGSSVIDNKTTLSIPANDYSDIELKAIWTGNTYSINYNTVLGTLANGYTPVSTYTTQEVNEYEIVTLPDSNKISRAGYTFAGWEIEINNTPASQIAGNDLKIFKNAYGDITVKAKWESKAYNISYSVNSGKWQAGYVVTITNYLTSSDVQTFDLPTSENIVREGYTFTGWEIITNTQPTYSSITGDNKVTLSIPANDYGDIVLNATWSINSYVLTIDLNHDGDNNPETPVGSTNETVTQNYATTYTPETPTREGYDFTGWSHSGGGTYNEGIYTFGIADGIISAQWKAQQYTLTVKPNGGKWANGAEEASVQDQSITQNYSTSLQINKPTREGYDFAGWTLVGGGSLSSDQIIYTFGVGDATLTANWTGRTYTITISGGTSSLATYQTSEQAQTSTLNAGNKNGYTFDMWDLTGSDNLKATAISTALAIPANSYGNIKLTAKYNVNVYTITYVMNDGQWVDGFDPITTYTIESDTITLPTVDYVTRTGYTFGGWKLKSDLSGSSVTKITSGSVGNVKVYAKWTINQYTLELYRNYDVDNNIENDGGPTNTITKNYNETVTIDITYERRGFTFKEWMYEGDGLFWLDETTGKYMYKFLGDGKLIAKWEMINFTMDLDFQGGTISYLDEGYQNARDYTYDIYNIADTKAQLCIY